MSPQVDNEPDDAEQVEKHSDEERVSSTRRSQRSVQPYDDPSLDWTDTASDILEDDSPYPEVRSAVANADDPYMPVSTLRAWTIGLTFSVLLSGLNQFLSFRYPTVTIENIAALLLVFPFGRAWARFMPQRKMFGIPLNPSPFTIKEHVIATIMASYGNGNSSGSSAYATDIIAVQNVFYGQRYSFAYQWMLVMSTQLIGYSFGGVARRFLVVPASMIWPRTLVTCALLNTIHTQHYTGVGGHGGMSRERFFILVFLIGGFWYFVPGYLFKGLSYFTWVCWIMPENVIINQLFGYIQGLGMSIVTFDWSLIAFNGSPLATPWWAQANVIVGFVSFFWIIAPVVYYTNVWNSAYLPLSSRVSFDNTGSVYDVSKILNPDATVNEGAYISYSPVFMSTTMAIAYGISFASITATISHSALYFGKQIWGRWCRVSYEQPDIHARLMERYQDVPIWWYLIIFVSMFVMGTCCITLWDTKLPVQWFIAALCISFVYLIPVGMIQAMTNKQVALSVLTEVIIGYALPGRPVALMLFKTWGYITMVQALAFTADFKLGHYMKIPPRTLFWAQLVSTVVGGSTQLAVQEWMFENIRHICSPTQKDDFVCAPTQVFGTASIVWGVIGPRKQLSSGQIYHGLIYCFGVGFVMPFITYALSRKFRNRWVRFLNFPVILSGLQNFPPAVSVNYVSSTAVGFIFQFYVRRRNFAWWSKYNYVLSAALDSSVAISALLIYFCLLYPKNGKIGAGTIRKWWGNTVFLETADARGTPLMKIPSGETFGPKSWS